MSTGNKHNFVLNNECAFVVGHVVGLTELFNYIKFLSLKSSCMSWTEMGLNPKITTRESESNNFI